MVVIIFTGSNCMGGRSSCCKKGFAHISPLWNNIFANTFILILWLPTVLILSHFRIILPTFPIVIAIFLGTGAYMFFFYAIEKGDISLTGALSAFYPVSTVILSTIFLHEHMSVLQVFGVIAAIVGVGCISFPNKKQLIDLAHHKTWVIWGLSSAIISGAGDFFDKIVSNHIGSYSQIFFAALAFQVLSVINFLVDKKGRTLPKFSFKKFFPTLSGTLLAVAGTMFFFLAFAYGPVSLISPAASIYPAIVVVLAVFFLHETITKRQFVGIISIVLGIVLIGFGG